MSTYAKAVFLDRDGVLNEAIIKDGKPYSPFSIRELKIADDVPFALQRLKAAGFLLIGATNQPDVARGLVPKENVEGINDELLKRLPLNEIRVCYHDDADQCHCRKPNAGLILDAAKEHGIDLSHSYMIGDRWKDIDAGKKAGCKTIWINNHYREKRAEFADAEVSNLSEAAAWILKRSDGVET